MTMPCHAIELELAAFVADELDPATAEAVARHLAGCADCRDEMTRELALRDALGALPVAQAPAGLGRLPRADGRRRLPAAAFGGLVAAALLVGLLTTLPTPAPAPRGTDVALSPAQADAVRRDAVRSLVLAARILERSEKAAVVDVFGVRLPRTVAESLRAGSGTPEGGQG